ncbi:MAG TPA: cytochrome c [Candidatus Koribacter sp.]|jgi:mono/diheme cytochrome c family protein
MRNFSRIFVSVAALLALAAPAFAGLTDDPVYDKQCAKCHGKTADGRHFGGPSLRTTSLSLDEIKTTIANGKGRMPKFADKLTPEQINALSAEIKELSGGQPSH